jgi:hypothetical protein
MKARVNKAASRHKGSEQTPRVSALNHTFPAPVRGWSVDEPLPASQPGLARILDNWVCTTRGVRVRGGRTEADDIGAPVLSLITYRAAVEKLIAATASGLYDVGGSAIASGLSSGDYSSVQFGTTGGDFVYMVNGVDAPQLYNGSTITAITGASSPAITGVTTTDLAQVWSFASRLWFVEDGTLSAWYLPTDSIGGAATEFSLAGVFADGGKLLFGAKWSLDAGDGLDDKCVFVSDEGEVAIYEGTNPSSASTWRRVGLYRMPRPLGKRAFTQAGGDLLIATVAGLIPVSAALKTDAGAIERKAVSLPIGTYWRTKASQLTARTWDVVKAHDMGVILVSQPDTSDTSPSVLMVNMVTGAWSRATGWDAQCIAYYGGSTYIGSLDGKVYLVDQGGTDDGALYTASYLGAFESLGIGGALKTCRQVRPLLEIGTPVSVQSGVNADYNETLPSPPSAAAEGSLDVWDSAIWDTARWDAGADLRTASSWIAAAATGTAIAPYLQMSFSGAARPDVVLASIDLQYHTGAVVA